LFKILKVVSTNISQPKTVKWRGKNVQTGIFKYPVPSGIYLESEDVRGDDVVDRKYHGGIDKACYLYSADIYDDWKAKFPDADWSLGMFGENITVQGLDEREIYVGDQYEVGECLVEVSEPREPCFKLGIRFGTQKVLKPFIASHSCGVYVRVLAKGLVKSGDEVKLVKRVQDKFSIARIYWLMYNATVEHINEVERAFKLDTLAISAKDCLRKRLAAIA
jgi:MOSC domain-containing protein YiiM